MGRALFTNPTTLSNDADVVRDDDHDGDSGVVGVLGKDDDSSKEGHDDILHLYTANDDG